MGNNRRVIDKMEDLLRYSPELNPDLEEFVRKYKNPYDLEKDDYERAPFAEEIVVSKRDPIYNMHTYWGKKVYKAIMKYIEHYTEPGDLVLDQFCGSGMTGVAALMTDRIPILIDLSPIATFIARHHIMPVDSRQIQKDMLTLLETEIDTQVTLESVGNLSVFNRKLPLYGEFKTDGKPIVTLQDELEWLYETRCDRCGGRAITRYVVWSERFQCERCLRVVPLYDCKTVEVFDKKGKKKTIRCCPHCMTEGFKIELKTRAERLGAVPVEVCYECLSGCKPKRGNRRHDDENLRKREFFAKYDLAKIEEIERREIPHWYPKSRMMNAPEDEERWGYLWRKYHKGIDRVDQMFTKRNLWALAALREGISRVSKQLCDSPLIFAFTGVLLGLSKMNRYIPRATFPFKIYERTYYVPAISQMEQVLHHFKNKAKRVTKGHALLRSLLCSRPRLISTQSATILLQIPDNSIDYIFTDPSYGDRTQYGELNFVWESWLEFDTSWIKDEIIINPIRGKGENDWAEMMKQALEEAYRVLKPGRWISLCYHDTSEGTWQTLQDILTDVGFELSEVGVLNPKQKSIKQVAADKVIKVDLVLNCRKPKEGEVIEHPVEDLLIERKVSDLIINCLQRKPGMTKDKIWNTIVAKLVSKGEMEKHDFGALLREVATENEARMWFLKDEYEEVKPSEREKEEKAASAIEKFMKERLEKTGLREVEFYDALFFYLAKYLRGKTRELAPMRRFPEILEDYFIRTTKGYRPPQTDDERAVLKEDRQKGTSRQIRRYVRHLVQGLPLPEEKKPDAQTIADWIKHCRRVGMYQEGAILYEKGGLIISKLPEKKIVDIEEDYKICKRRSKRRR